MSLLFKAFERLKNNGARNAWMYAVSRFSFIRVLTLFLHKLTRKKTAYDVQRTLFKDVGVRRVLASLQKDAFYLNLTLPKEIASEVREFADKTRCFIPDGERKYEFFYLNRGEIKKNMGKEAVLAYYQQPALFCPAINKIQNDPLILEIASRYLGGDPRRIDSRLWWSFATQASVSERLKAQQTVLFHYDLESYIFIYFNFYITDVDPAGGPHIAVRGSHKKKKLSFLFSSANQPDENIFQYYGKENIMTICGKSGYGFIEDSFCFHKALPPTSQDRLFLQVRMS